MGRRKLATKSRRILSGTRVLCLSSGQLLVVKHEDPTPTVDLSQEEYLRGAAWQPVSCDNPLGPLNPAYWHYLAPVIHRLLFDQKLHARSCRKAF